MLMQRLRGLRIWRRKPVIFFTGLLACFFVFCIIRMLMPCREYRYEGSCAFQEGIAARNQAVYSGLRLGPGVYRIELEYASDTDLGAVSNVEDGTVFAGGLLSNGEHMYANLNRTGYDIWLFEKTDALQVVVSYEGKGSLTTGNLRIIETNGIWTMLLASLIFVGIGGYAVILFYYYNEKYPVSKEKKNVFFFVTVIGLLSSVPYICGYTITGADLTYHMQRIGGVKDGLLGGQFPVRLEPKWLYGHGYANAIFYCNLFLYFPALLRLLGFPVLTAYNAYCIVLNLATAWISFYCYTKIFKRRNIGIICSALYTLSAFRIYRYIVISAAGEGTALAFLPLALYGLHRVFTEDPEEKEYRTAWIPLMLGFAGIVQSHVLTCEITVLVTLIFCVACIRKIFCLKTFVELAKAATGAILLSLWFLTPFLDYYITQDMQIKHGSARTIQERGLSLIQQTIHFWRPDENKSDTILFQFHNPEGIGLTLLIALGVFMVLWLSEALRKQERSRAYFAKATAATGALLLLMSTNIFPWDRIQFMNPIFESLVGSIQFPYRFLGWATACFVFLFGYCMECFEGQGKKWGNRIMTMTAVAAVATSSMYILDYVNSSQPYFTLYNDEGMGFGYIAGAEYLIYGTDESRLTFDIAHAGSGTEINAYEKNYLKVEMNCSNTTDDMGYVDLPILWYKGYEAADADTGQKLQVSAGENNLLRVWVPAGYDGNIVVDFVSPVYWRISEIITLAAATAGIAAAARAGRSRKMGDMRSESKAEKEKL